MARKILTTLEIKNFSFQINSIGNKESLKNIAEAVRRFAKNYKNTIEESLFLKANGQSFGQGPMRVRD